MTSAIARGMRRLKSAATSFKRRNVAASFYWREPSICLHFPSTDQKNLASHPTYYGKQRVPSPSTGEGQGEGEKGEKAKKRPAIAKLVLTLLLLLLLAATPAWAQDGNEAVNYHSGNKLRLSFSNDGRLDIRNDELTAEWPIGTGREYLNMAIPLVAVRQGGVHMTASFLADASFAGGQVGVAAMSHREDTWPATWVGRWNGYFGAGTLNADQESFIALEDPALGLRLTIRGWQWSSFLAQDMILFHYELENVGSTAFDETTVGFFARPAPGGDGMDGDRLAFDRDRALAVSVDTDDEGRGRGVAQGVGRWSPVGRLAVALLETPGNATDGIDNDGDGLVDESRADGIDNDGDWNPNTDDLGEDGLVGTNDAGENDGSPTPGEPNFDATDVDEADQIGLTSLAAFVPLDFDRDDDNKVQAAFVSGRFDNILGPGEFVMGSGSFPLVPGQTERFSVALFLSANAIDEARNEAVVRQIYDANYRFAVAPPRPRLHAVAQDGSATLYWDNRAEASPGFEGYKIYRSTDPGFNDVFTVTDDKGVLIYSEPVATFDLDNDVSKLFGLHANGFRYFLGNNTGLAHQWTDSGLVNGRTYYYAVVAYNRGDATLGIFPSESTKSIVADRTGALITDVNTAIVTPTAESSGYQAPEFAIEHTGGFSTGTVTAEVVDRTLIKNGQYELAFAEDDDGAVTYSLFDVTEGRVSIFENSSNFSTNDLLNDADPLFDGLRAFAVDDVLEWDSLSTTWREGNANWSIRMILNSNLGAPVAVAANYEVRFAEAGVDTALFTTPIPVPFEVWNVTDNKKENILVIDQNQDGAWSSGEPIYVVAGNSIEDFRPVHWMITLTEPSDPAVTPVAPSSGDVAFIPTFKPFAAGDVYRITTTAARVETALDENVLDRIAAVPNPYVINASVEQQSLFTGGRSERRLQFINLPQRCTIRIFDTRGRLVDVIEHDEAIENGTAFWDLHTKGSTADTVAYGIYIYHVDAPEIGEKIGRFAVIR